MNAFLDNGFCQDELNIGDCMFDGLDCCGYDYNKDGDYDDFSSGEFAPGDTKFCSECLCKGVLFFNKYSQVSIKQASSLNNIQYC